jgi:hypothetical protein
VGDLGGGVKPPGSGDAGTAGQAQTGQTSQGLFPPGREPNSRSGAVTTVTLAIQVAAQAAIRAAVVDWRHSLNVIGSRGVGVPPNRRLGVAVGRVGCAELLVASQVVNWKACAG